ncbi:MAG: cation transporter [Clostridia bacterium]
MKRNYKLEGLDCANCAAKLENAIAKVNGVSNVSISFMTLKMIIDIAEDNFDQSLGNVMAVIKKMEPDVEPRRC